MTLDLDYSTIMSYEESHPEMDGEAIGMALTSTASKAQLRAWAVDRVRLIVDSQRRSRAREAEERATQRAIERQHFEQAEQEFQQVLDDPPTDWPIWNAKRRAEFRKWAGDRFNDWYERARRGVRNTEFFESDWHPDGPRAYWNAKRMEGVLDLIREHAEQVRLETTAELLGTVIALGDGTETTWGEATVAQHEQRIALCASNAAGNVETAARHRAAIKMIEDAGATCLADLAPVAATS